MSPPPPEAIWVEEVEMGGGRARELRVSQDKPEEKRLIGRCHRGRGKRV